MSEYQWLFINALIVIAYGIQHSLLTTKVAVRIYNKILPNYTWNIVYSVFSVITLALGFQYWQRSGVILFSLPSGGLLYHISVVLLALSLFFFFYCFKYTTSFSQWIGVRQIANKITGKEMPAYYRVRQEGIKRYIRFPHHTCLIVLFWTHPQMTLDTLFLAISATLYLYLGTWHQDKRGLAMIGPTWQEYQQKTNLLLPGSKALRSAYQDYLKSKKGPEPSSFDNELPK